MNYSFLTTESWRIDVTAKNPKQGYKIAEKKLEESILKSNRGVFGASEMFGKLSGTYFKYDKDGLHAVDGEYFQI